MKYLSLFSGIEAASVAWHPLGWECVGVAEVEKFPCAVLAHHYPNVPNLGDVTKFKEWKDVPAFDVLVGGSPCQSFSVAGLRKGLADPRGNLMLTYLAIAGEYRPKWVLWENVPGVLSIDGGRAFGSFLGGLAELGYGFAYRVLDAQHFGVPQRRRRVFVVGHLGDWRRAAAVLFERESLRGDPAPSRQEGERVAPSLEARTRGGGGGWGTDFLAGGGMIPEIANPLTRRMRKGINTTCDEGQTLIAGHTTGAGFWKEGVGTIRAREQESHEHLVAFNARQDPINGPIDTDPSTNAIAFKASHFTRGKDGAPADVVPPLSADADKGDQDTLVMAFESRFVRNGRGAPSDVVPPLKAQSGQSGKGDAAPLVAFQSSQSGVREVEAHATLDSNMGSRRHNGVFNAMQVRRITPTEAERLQGFPDGWTAIPFRGKPAADGPRYKALGNSMAVPCMAWLGRRIQSVSDLA